MFSLPHGATPPAPLGIVKTKVGATHDPALDKTQEQWELRVPPPRIWADVNTSTPQLTAQYDGRFQIGAKQEPFRGLGTRPPARALRSSAAPATRPAPRPGSARAGSSAAKEGTRPWTRT